MLFLAYLHQVIDGIESNHEAVKRKNLKTSGDHKQSINKTRCNIQKKEAASKSGLCILRDKENCILLYHANFRYPFVGVVETTLMVIIHSFVRVCCQKTLIWEFMSC